MSIYMSKKLKSVKFNFQDSCHSHPDITFEFEDYIEISFPLYEDGMKMIKDAIIDKEVKGKWFIDNGMDYDVIFQKIKEFVKHIIAIKSKNPSLEFEIHGYNFKIEMKEIRE